MSFNRRSFILMILLPIGATLILGMSTISNFPIQAASGKLQRPNAVRALDDLPTETDVPGRPELFNPYDGRTDANAGDRLAVYCYTPYREIEVWGIDEQSQGVYLNTFDYDDTLAAGAQGVTVILGRNGTLSLSVDSQYNFVLFWNGPYNYTNHGNFVKSFNCVYVGGSPTPKANVTRSPGGQSIGLPRATKIVYTVTPIPTATPNPTQSLYE
jgi:ABC-type antimicrobial peptide transport system permease subunit